MNNRTKRVINGFTHANYASTVKDAKFYRQIVTGEGYGELIFNYKPRESDLQKEQRVAITQNRTKSIAGKVEGFFKRVFRADKLALEVTHNDETSKQLLALHTTKYGNDGQSLLAWSEEAALYYNNLDPNALYWVKHSVVDNEDKFEPYVFNSEQAKAYEIKKGRINWAVCQVNNKVNYTSDKKDVQIGINLYYYFDANGLEMTIEVNNDVLKNGDFYEQFINENGDYIGELEKYNDNTYLVIFYPSEIDFVPISRMGYKYSEKSNRGTYVCFWDNATEEYKMLVDDGSVFDVAKKLHGFPKQISYYSPCNYQDTTSGHVCRGGKIHPTKETCGKCKGTGQIYHVSEQDIIYIKLPTEDEPNVIPPKDLVHYVSLPIDFLEMQERMIDKSDPKITKAIFGVDVSNPTTGMATATQITSYYDTAQDVMFEFTEAPVKLYEFSVDTIAAYLGIKDVQRQIIYTNEYDLESEDYLLTLLAKAKEAGASPEVIENINKRLVIKQNRTDSTYMSVYTAMRKFLPFSSVEPTLKEAIILSLPDSDLQRALYLNFKEISEDIINNHPTFLMETYDKQKKLVEAKAQIFADKAVKSNSVQGIGSFTDNDLIAQ